MQYTIIKHGERLDSFYGTQEEFDQWMQIRRQMKSFGEEARIEKREVVPAIPATFDEEGIELTPEMPAIYEDVEIPGDYTVEIKDITTELEQSKINAEALAYLAATDYLIVRELDAGTPCPPEIKQARTEARG